MSTVTSQPLPKEDEEEDDEEQGEKFCFEDSGDEEKQQEDSRDSSDPARPVQVFSETSDGVPRTATDGMSSPDGLEGVTTEAAASVQSTAGNTFSGII